MEADSSAPFFSSVIWVFLCTWVSTHMPKTWDSAKKAEARSIVVAQVSEKMGAYRVPQEKFIVSMCGDQSTPRVLQTARSRDGRGTDETHTPEQRVSLLDAHQWESEKAEVPTSLPPLIPRFG